MITVSHLHHLLNDTGLSAENLATYLNVSGMTIRRYLKDEPSKALPTRFAHSFNAAVCALAAQGKLPSDSLLLTKALPRDQPLNLQETLSGAFAGLTDHQLEVNFARSVSQALLQVGQIKQVQHAVINCTSPWERFMSLGADWRSPLTFLLETVRSDKISHMQKWTAYGALFYLLTPLDLIPDTIPLTGFFDDFGVLTSVVTSYRKKMRTALTHRVRKLRRTRVVLAEQRV